MDWSLIADPFQQPLIPLGAWAEAALQWTVDHFRGTLMLARQPVHVVLTAMESGLRGTPSLIVLGLITLLAWQVAGRRVGILVAMFLAFIGLIGAWGPAMTTLAIVLTSVTFCILIGIPLGILAARNDRFEGILRPVLDLMQTIPSFVYLVPVVMLFGIGNVPGVLVTIIYALAPIVRLTNLGIRQVRPDLVEAAVAFGGNPRQTLYKIQLPLALPTIMAGVNQTIMMALAMSVVASMISVTGLGQMVLRGIGRLDMSVATVGGIGIVLVAITIDRISQGFGLTRRQRGHRHWYETGPAGLVLRLIHRSREVLTPAPDSGTAPPGGKQSQHLRKN
jgi:glycine betaine/proline transport system permease protein